MRSVEESALVAPLRRFRILATAGLSFALSAGIWVAFRAEDSESGRTRRAAAEAKPALRAFIRGLRLTAVEAAADPVLREATRAGGRRMLFEACRRILAEGRGRGVEGAWVLDSRGVPLAWAGRIADVGGPSLEAVAQGRPSLFLDFGEIGRLLVALEPLPGEPRRGSIAVCGMLETHTPVASRLLAEEGLLDRIASRHRATANLRRLDAPPRRAGMNGIDIRGEPGEPALARCDFVADATLESLAGPAAGALAFLALAAPFLLVWGPIRRFPWLLPAGLLAVRALWLALKFPAHFFPSTLWEPIHYGVTFLWPAFGNPGETLITAAFAALAGLSASRVRTLRSPWLGLPLAGIGGAALGAAIESLARDSSVPFYGPSMIPGGPASALLCAASLFALAAAGFLAPGARALAEWLGRLGPAALALQGAGVFAGVFLAAAMLAAAAGIGLLLAGALGVGLLASAALAGGAARNRAPIVGVLGGLILAGFLPHAFLVGEVSAAFRDDLLADLRRVSKEPVDRWFADEMDRQLDFIGQDEEVKKFLQRGSSDGNRVALSLWARSPFGERGIRCLIEIIDAKSAARGRFSLDVPLSVPGEQLVEDLGGVYSLRLTGAPGLMIRRFYSGRTAISGPGGEHLGFVLLKMPASEHFFGGRGTPEVFRPSTPSRRWQRVVLREWREGETTPRGFAEAVRRIRGSGGEAGAFAFESGLDGRPAQALVAPRRETGSPDGRITGWVALVYETIAPAPWALRTFKGFLGAIPAIAGALLLFAWVAGLWSRFRVTFRARILGAFIALVLVLVVGIGAWHRRLILERYEDALRERIDSALRLAQSMFDPTAPAGGASLEPVLRAVREAVGADLNVYEGERLVRTSQPGLFGGDLLSDRLPGEVYDRLLLQGEREVVVEERLGRYPFRVGYRRIGPPDAEARTISAPVLYRQEEVRESTAREEEWLLGTLVLFTLSAGAVAWILSGRIARPLRDLTEGTSRIAGGEFDVVLPERRSDEIGLLVKSFNRMSHALRDTLSRLRDSERKAAFSEMARQVAHEIKNPLTPMKLSLQHVLRARRDARPDFDEILAQSSKMIGEQIDALERIATEFSLYARFPKGDLKPEALEPILKAAADLVAVEGEPRSVRVRLSVGANLPRVTCDVDRLRRALLNLLRNALQAMPGGGDIDVRAARSGVLVRIEVSDHGSGIPAEIRERIFEPYFSTKTGGTGLGLALTKRIIEEHGGKIGFESKAAGTTFWIELPYTEPAP